MVTIHNRCSDWRSRERSDLSSFPPLAAVLGEKYQVQGHDAHDAQSVPKLSSVDSELDRIWKMIEEPKAIMNANIEQLVIGPEISHHCSSFHPI